MKRMLKQIVVLAVLAMATLVPLLSQAMTSEETVMLSNAAERGNDGAQLLLAFEYLHGDIARPKDEKQAAYWFERAAVQGNVAAQKMLGDLYEQGRGVPENLKVSADWRTKAALRGNTDAQVSLGKMYLAGGGVEKSPEKAEYWLQRAAIEGNSEAQFLLGKMYKLRDSNAREQALSGNMLAKSASQGFGSAAEFLQFMENARYKVSELFHQRPADIHKLAEDGDADSQYRLATRYESGHGEPQDNAKTLYWFKKAADNGHVMAMKSLAHIYTKGLDGVTPDAKIAEYWTLRAQSTKP
jgi:TPR repeat protein